MSGRAFEVIDYPQGSPEWHHARIGRLTGSRAAAMLAKVKSGEAASRRDLRVQLVCERLTTIEQEPDFHSRWMQRGQDREAEAIAEYEAATGNIVRFAGFMSHTEHMAGCSPDGYLGDFEELLEVKVPKAAIHLEYWRKRAVPPQYVAQLRHNMWTGGFQRAHFISFGPDFPEAMRLFIVTVDREALDIAGYEVEALRFLWEVDADLREVMDLSAAGWSTQTTGSRGGGTSTAERGGDGV